MSIKDNSKKGKGKIAASSPLDLVNRFVAGIDVGSCSHFVAAPIASGEIEVREYNTFTTDLNNLAIWLKELNIVSVVMESTGVYWIPMYEILEKNGIKPVLVNARHVKNVSGRKTDVQDCQWLQQLHSLGLLCGAFRPEDKILPLRSYQRHKTKLVEEMVTHIQHMQKSMTQMNIQLSNVITDITGTTGMKIIRAIVKGERNPKILADFRDPRCKNSLAVIEKSLQGNWREEHLFVLKQSLTFYDFYLEQIRECDDQIEFELKKLNSDNEGAYPDIDLDKQNDNQDSSENKSTEAIDEFELKKYLQSMIGVDLTKIPGIGADTALKIIGEIGLDINRWPSANHFSSWLGLCPNNKISGGRILSSKTTRTANRAAIALRMSASALYRSKCALGGFLRRVKSKSGPAKAITATAHKLAVIIYCMIKNGEEYVEIGLEQYEKKFKERKIKSLRKQLEELGVSISQIDAILT